MTFNGYVQLGLYIVVLLALAKPLGAFMARVYTGQSSGLDRVLGPLERLIYRLCGVRAEEEMGWKTYAIAMLLFNLFGFLAVYALQRLQGGLPLNPQGFGAVTPDSSFNTATSFATNTNWQGYGGEVTMSYLTQMLALTVQNFASAATGMAVLVAFIRGLVRHTAQTIGNFWVDLTRSTLYILLPLSLVLALVQVSQGMVQNFSAYQTVPLLQPTTYEEPKLDADGKPLKDADDKPVTETKAVQEQVIPMGPAASQVAIKQLGTNGGGFFNVNSAHPFENPTPLTNFLEMLAILLIAAALCYTFGVMVGDTRQGWAVLAAMTLVFVSLLALCVWAEQSGNPRIAALGVDTTASDMHPGGNMEGKEVRIGIVNSALWATATTAASNGSVNAMHDSFTPLGGLVPLFMIQLSEVIFGGVGSGLYGMLIYVIIAVFVAGLMVGRTPEYLGKKIESYEMKMASLIILVPPLLVLVCTALAVVTEAGKAGAANPGAHGFSEILYAFSSMGNNNGSAFAGVSANTPFYNLVGGIQMLASRYWIAVPALAIAGALARKKLVPAGLGTLPTHTPLFVAMLIGVVIIVGALTFIPALALGPIVEHLLMVGA
ncbi:MAG TPA: potassium-transporting ATPase subunit KdpA [Candidatus Saccharimonadia bacterium]|nr:potassium-transporting ATPase subunit KdpA [Candidatus Saccharimonadia bacterium]